MQTLLNNARFEDAIAHGSRAAATSNINGRAADMAGYAGIVVRVEFAAIAARAVTKVKVQESDSAASGWVDIEGASVNVPADHDNKYVTVDVPSVRKRYARVVIARGTANAAIASAQYIKYNPNFAPLDQPAADLTAIVTR